MLYARLLVMQKFGSSKQSRLNKITKIHCLCISGHPSIANQTWHQVFFFQNGHSRIHKSQFPNPLPGRQVTLNPSISSARHESRTHLCSICEVMTCFFLDLQKRATPLTAMLFDSVAPEVKMISRGSAPIRDATWALWIWNAKLDLISIKLKTVACVWVTHPLP